MIMRHITKILTIAIVLLGLSSCFKEEKQGTLLKVAVFSQNVASDEITHTETELMAYAFHVPEDSEWEVASWEDALAMRISNTERVEHRTDPEVVGTINPNEEHQVEMGLWSHTVFMVVVDVENKLYATRLYETPINLPTTYVQLHLYAHKKSGSANGWTTTNPFPDEQRAPLTPEGDGSGNQSANDNNER